MLLPITVSAIVKAEKTQVWQCFTDPKHIVNWNFASPDWHCPSAENDLRVGGKFTSVMAARDGSFSFDFTGIYSEVTEHESFTYSMPDGRNVHLKFESQGEDTLVTEVFDPENENPVELQQEGWQAILNNFKAYAELQL
jgi:uncharacterized protein YndB with AHSA1/START domain